MGIENIKKQLMVILGEAAVKENVSMAEHTSFKAGGKADIMVMPQNTEDLRKVLGLLADADVQSMILGNGSNILVKDSGYRGVIVKMGEGFDYIEADGETLTCGAASLLSAAAKEAMKCELEGFEFASGIPGSVGGAIFMNAGAYGGEMAHIVEKVHLVSRDGSRDFYKTAEELDMGYRHTALHESGDVVVDVTIRLKKGNKAEILNRMNELTQQRNSKQPVNYPSAGSFFKRPEGYFAGKLVQDAGLKGLTVGGAQVSELHSGFVINIGGATATDILQLKDIVQARVMEEFGVMLEPEVRIIGE